MVGFTYVVQNCAGLHARPATRICSFALSYRGVVTIALGETVVNARNVMDVMGLCARQGDELAFEIEGAGEQEAADALKTVLASCL